MIDYAKLKMDLAKAKQRAKDAADKVEDTGSCNTDHVFIPVGSCNKIKRGSKKLSEIFGDVIFHSGWHHGYFAPIPTYGLGYKNTVAQEAAAKALREYGAYVFYQLD